MIACVGSASVSRPSRNVITPSNSYQTIRKVQRSAQHDQAYSGLIRRVKSVFLPLAMLKPWAETLCHVGGTAEKTFSALALGRTTKRGPARSMYAAALF